MYSEVQKNNFEMIFSLNCLFLGESSIRTIQVIISEKIIIANNEIPYKKISVSNVKSLILSEKQINYPLDQLNLWKVDCVKVNQNNDLLETFSTEDEIKEKLGGELMIPRFQLESYFKAKEINTWEIHIFVVPTSTGKCLPMFYLSTRTRICSNKISSLV
jgi:hypothetical protein